MKKNTWSKDEVDFLEKNYGTMSCSDIGKKLFRSKDSVQKKLKTIRDGKEQTCPSEAAANMTNRLLRENKNLRDKLSAASNMEDVFLSAFKKAIDTAEPIPPPKQFFVNSKKTKKVPCHMGFEFSDLQMGMFIKPEDTIFLGGYNFDIFKRRLQHFKEVVITIAEENRLVRPIDDLIIFGLGDYVEGEQIFPSQALFLDLCAADQFVQGVQEISVFLRDLACHFNTVRMFGVWGNHGRLGRYGHGHPRSNMDYLLLKTLQMRMADIQNIKIHVSSGPVMAVEIFGRIHLLRHGDDTFSWNGVPFYGMERDTLKYANLLRAPVSDAHVGHHHRQASWEVSTMKIHMNGSFCGPTPFGLSAVKSADLPSQSVFVLHPEHGITWRAPIWLEKAPVLKKNIHGILTPHT